MNKKFRRNCMEEIKNKVSDILEKITSERFFYYYIISVMLALPITEIFDEFHSQAFASQPIIVEMAGYFGIFAFITHFLRHQKIKYYLSDLLYFLLFIFALLSAVFSINKQETWHGFNYDEWLFNFVGYFSLMLAGTMIQSKQLRKNILSVFVIVTIIQSIVAALQTVGIYIVEAYFDNTYVGDYSEVELPITSEDLEKIYPLASSKAKERALTTPLRIVPDIDPPPFISINSLSVIIFYMQLD